MQTLSIVLTCLICLPVGHVCQGFYVFQPQGRVEALERSNVTLVCVMFSETPLGPVRWYKGAGSERTDFYSAAPKGGDRNDPRVTWTMENMTLNYSITIRDLRVSDTGEYYCEKYTKADNESKPYASGPGVTLTVTGVPIITGPASRVKVGNDLRLTCEVNGANNITVKWFKDEQEVTPELRDTSGGRNSSRSVIRLTPKIKDIKSVIRCQESGLSAQNPQEDKFHLKDVIAGPPSIKGPQKRVETGQTVSFTCASLGDQDTSITWLKGETTVPGGQKMSWSDGTRSELKVTLSKTDVKSSIYCQIPGYRGGSVPSNALNFSTFILAIPEVTILKMSAEDSHNSSSFHCRISGFYPDDIKVMWLLEGQTLNSILFQSIKNPDGTFTAFTLIDVIFTNEVKQLTCVVTHMGNRNLTDSVEVSKRSSGEVSDGSSASACHVPLWFTFILVKVCLFVTINAFFCLTVKREIRRKRK